MTELSHLHAIQDRLIRERARLETARTGGERALRVAWVAQAEREVAAERDFLGLAPDTPAAPLSDDELLAELLAA